VINILTIDFEDWYHGLTSTSDNYEEWGSFERRLEDTTAWLLAALSEHSVRATFFILGVVAREYPHLVQAIAEAGHEIGLHGDIHRLVRTMDRQVFRRDLASNQTAVESAAGRAATCFRAPCFSVSPQTPWLWDELARAGLGADSSLFPVRTPLYGMPLAPRNAFLVPTSNGEVVEAPMSTIRVLGVNLPFSGGFYFRVLPYALVKALTSSKNANRQQVVFYFHPWEFDLRHPRPKCLTARERVSHYAGLNSTRSKLLRLLGDFEFGPLAALKRPDQVVDHPLQSLRSSSK
jgi:polysaccharide deacetylase family protein (PEP-CTERM system associated)